MMRQWLLSWYGVSYQSAMTRGMRHQMDRRASMTAEEFEIHVMKMMIRHHWTAVVRASGCIDRAFRAELIQICTDIVETQTG